MIGPSSFANLNQVVPLELFMRKNWCVFELGGKWEVQSWIILSMQFKYDVIFSEQWMQN